MAIGDITLTSAMRANLVSLQQTANFTGTTQTQLATGKKVNSALDNPTNYFAAQAHTERANLLNGLKDNISEAIQTIKAADNGVKAVTTMIEAIRGLVTQARTANSATTSATDLASLTTQYGTLISQLNSVTTDAGYKGVNFLSSTTTMTVNFNEGATSTLVMSGFAASSSGLAISGGSVTGTGSITSANLTGATNLDNIETTLNNALATLRTNSAKLSANLSILSTRQQFITDMVNTLTDGANNLTAADTNEAGANLLALQTRQQLGVTSLSLASQANQAILRLF
jgi:flagellin-like hook-associated protein FlgL